MSTVGGGVGVGVQYPGKVGTKPMTAKMPLSQMIVDRRDSGSVSDFSRKSSIASYASRKSVAQVGSYQAVAVSLSSSYDFSESYALLVGLQ